MRRLALALVLAACGGATDGSAPVELRVGGAVTIEPRNVIMAVGTTLQFVATGRGVSFSASCGTITAAGLYTATVPGMCVVTAKSKQGNASATVSVGC